MHPKRQSRPLVHRKNTNCMYRNLWRLYTPIMTPQKDKLEKKRKEKKRKEKKKNNPQTIPLTMVPKIIIKNTKRNKGTKKHPGTSERVSLYVSQIR